MCVYTEPYRGYSLLYVTNEPYRGYSLLYDMYSVCD